MDSIESWQDVEKLISPDSIERESALDSLMEQGAPRISPLIAYILATRISDPDLELRTHIIKALGSILSVDENGQFAADHVITHLHGFFEHISKDQILDLLEIGEHYLSAEDSLVNIFKLCSYAGNKLNGIVNDQKIPLSLRKQAIYYCGVVGFLEAKPSIQSLIDRVEKRNLKQRRIELRRKDRDEQELYPYAVAALERLGNEFTAG